MVAARLDDAAAESGGNAADAETVPRRADVAADPPQRLDDGLDAVRLLHAELARAADDGLAARVAGGEGEQRQLVDQRRHLARPTRSRPTSSEARISTSPAGSPPSGAAVVDRDPRAHALEDVEEADPARVEPDAVHGERRSRDDRRRDEQRRRGREVAGDVDSAELEPLRADRP